MMQSGGGARRHARLTARLGFLVACGSVAFACDGGRHGGMPRDGGSGEIPDGHRTPDAAGRRTIDTGLRPVMDATPPGDTGLRPVTDAMRPGEPGDAGSRPDSGATSPVDGGGTPYTWNLPQGFPVPVVPADNPMTVEKVRLGRYLFYDTRLSGNQTQSCSTCHQQELAFTDGRAQGLGSTGMLHPRSPMSLANVAYASTLTWANPLMTDLEHQALVPMFGDDPIELGLNSEDMLDARLSAVPIYQTLFADAWPGDPSPVTGNHVVQAIASFERTLISGRSAFDRYQYGETGALNASAQRGYVLFNSDAAGCFHCHIGFDLTDHINWDGKAFFEKPYHNTGLYNIDGKGAYPEPNTGVEHVTHVASDMGRFKAPTLRNIAKTAPYMHDGSIATLDAVLDHYAAGGRTITSGPYAGHGNLNPYKDPLVEGFTITADQRADLLAFLASLTDDAFLTDPDLSSPW